MIVPMKKIFMVTRKKDAPAALEALRAEGIVHVEHTVPPAGEGTQEIKEDLRLLERVLQILPARDQAGDQSDLSAGEWKEKAAEITRHLDRIGDLTEEKARRRILISEWEPWGDFDSGDFEALGERGLIVKLCRIPLKEVARVPSDVIARKIFVSGSEAGCLLIGKGKTNIPYREISPPPISLGRMKEEQEAAQRALEESEAEIARAGRYGESFRQIFRRLESELAFRQARAGMGESGELNYLKGYCPAGAAGALEEKARQERWALLVQDPSEEDRVPTLLRNPRWVRLIRPVIDFLNIVPGYREKDISPVFLIFLSVFFGILVGDAGYGAVFFAGTLFAQFKMARKVKKKYFFFLMYVMSLCAVIYGILSGTFFGQAWLPASVQPLLPWLRSNENVQLLSFIVGVIHLSVAHLWRVAVRYPSRAFVGELGWFMVLWAMFFWVLKVVLGYPLPEWANALFGGAPLVLFFAHPRKNILRTLGAGLGDLLLNIVNTFTDIISYIRLFAVGLATVALADAFNQIALGLTETDLPVVVIGLAAGLILILGHTLNMVLAALAILVHGVRLNILEFSLHINLEWAGIPFRPLSRPREIET